MFHLKKLVKTITGIELFFKFLWNNANFQILNQHYAYLKTRELKFL